MTPKLLEIARGMRNKHQNIEEPCEAKVSSTVLKTSRDGDILAEFNQEKAGTSEPLLDIDAPLEFTD